MVEQQAHNLIVDGSNPSRVTSGRVAEWFKAAVLKTEGPKGSVGSNPTSSAIIPLDSGSISK